MDPCPRAATLRIDRPPRVPTSTVPRRCPLLRDAGTVDAATTALAQHLASLTTEPLVEDLQAQRAAVPAIRDVERRAEIAAAAEQRAAELPGPAVERRVAEIHKELEAEYTEKADTRARKLAEARYAKRVATRDDRRS